MTVSIGVMGMGLMGAAVAKQLLELGYKVTVWNRTAERCAALADLGARVAQTPDQLVRQSDAIIALLANCDVLDALIDQVGTGLEGKDVLNLVTGSPNQIRSSMQRAQGYGAHVLTGAIQAYPSGIGSGGAAIICAGESEVWKRLEGVVRGLAGSSYWVAEDVGRPSVLDSAVTGCFFFTAMSACLEGASYAASDGLSVKEFRQSAKAYAQMLPAQLDLLFDAIEQGDTSTNDATLHTFAASLTHFRRAFSDVGASDVFLRANYERMSRAIDEGYGDQGFTALFGR